MNPSDRFSFDSPDRHKGVSFASNHLVTTFSGDANSFYRPKYGANNQTGAADEDGGDTDDEFEEENEDERLASLEALRYALHHAPFCRNMHTLMSVPNEAYYEMQGIPTKCAIRVEQLYYENILDDVNMEVPKGKIYALLGSANNGKSTLLKCIVGRVKPTSGSIVTFGSRPACTPLSAICVGYMPQEVALHQELSIGQTLQYYGRLYQLPLYMIVERVQFLKSLLNLPDENLLIQELNPGQKWRMSLAVALIHSPPLLLLDEPTVNVDPLIRSSVWSRLQRLCDEEGLTVLVTTQYPEEVSFAYKVGLMRNGHVYVEDSPQELRRYYNCKTYDQLYTKFCMSNVPRRIRPSIAPYLMAAGLTTLNTSQSLQSISTAKSSGEFGSEQKSTSGLGDSQQESTDTVNSNLQKKFPLLDNLTIDREMNRSSSMKNDGETSLGSIESVSRPDLHSELGDRLNLPMAEWPICERRRTAYISHFINLDLKRLLALVLKNIYVIQGNLYMIVLFYFIFPVLQIFLVCVIFGRTVSNLPVTIVNEVRPGTPAISERFSSVFANSFLNHRIFNPHHESLLEQANHLVRKGQSWATIVPWTMSPLSNQSQSSQNQSSLCHQWHQQMPMFGIKLHLDNSNYLISQQMFYSFINSMRAFLQSDSSSKLLAECVSDTNKSPSTAIDIEEVIYGSTKFRFLEFLLPGFLVCLVFAYSLVLTAYLFIKECLAGLQERCLATGTSGVEVLLAHFLSQATIFFLQETLLLLIVLNLFGLPSRGPLYSLWLLLFLQGMVGIWFGLFIAAICPRPLGAAMFTSGIVIPAFFLSGIIWPIEAMPKVALHISHLFPLTLPINALRYIISRGSDMHYSQIVIGFTVTTSYITVLLMLTICVFKYKTSS